MLRTFLGVARVVGVIRIVIVMTNKQTSRLINLVLVCNASIFSIAPLRRYIYIYI